MQKMVGGVLANYEVKGEKNKQNLVILHGWGANGQEWRQVAQELAQKYRVVVVDLPGFGGTPKPKEVWGVYEYAGWVKGFLTRIGVKSAVVVGHSFGGRVGIVLAAYTKVVERLVLVDAAGIERENWKGRLVEMAKPVTKYLPQEIKNWFGSADYKTAGQMRQIFVRVVNQDLEPEFGQVKCPTLIVWGERDEVLGVGQAKEMLKGIEGSTVRVVWGAGHWPHISHSEELMTIFKEEGI